MKLISPNFLEKINDQWHREKVLLEMFKDEELISIVMIKKQVSFDQACEFVSQLCYGKAAPEASESEKRIMMRVAKEVIDDWKKSNASS
jgi:hypothetical protein